MKFRVELYIELRAEPRVEFYAEPCAEPRAEPCAEPCAGVQTCRLQTCRYVDIRTGVHVGD